MFLKVLCLLSIINLLVTCNLAKEEPSRKIEVQWNPNCNIPKCRPDNYDSNINLVYVKATGKNDTIHYLYSTIDSFTILIFKSDIDGKLSIDWEKLLSNETSGSIQVEGAELVQKSGYVIPTIYEFNDMNFTADMTKISQNESDWVKFETSDLTWSKFSDHPNSIGVLTAKLNDETNSTSEFKFIIKVPGTDSRDKDLPHLLLKPESSSLDIIIDTPASFEFSKFGMEFLYLSDGDSFNLTEKITMDDEYTPGTFKLWNIEFNKNKNEAQNYFQTKPIFYFYDPRTLENSTLVQKYEAERKLEVPNSIANGFFDGKNLAYGMNFSLGIEGNAKDGFFHKQTNYSVWSFSVGLNQAPTEKMSFVVLLVIAIGFGLPALIIVSGIFLMLVKKLRNSQRSEFEQLD